MISSMGKIQNGNHNFIALKEIALEIKRRFYVT